MAFGCFYTIWMDDHVADCFKYNCSDDEIFWNVSRIRTGTVRTHFRSNFRSNFRPNFRSDIRYETSIDFQGERKKVPSCNERSVHDFVQFGKFYKNVRVRSFQLFSRSLERFRFHYCGWINCWCSYNFSCCKYQFRSLAPPVVRVSYSSATSGYIHNQFIKT